MRILLVEDEIKVGRFIRRGFGEVAYFCTWVTTIADAEDALAETTYDLIVLDLGLPDGDGLTLLRRWRGCGFNEPVIVLSAKCERGDRVTGLNEGADDYLGKPFGFDELLARTRSLLRRRDCEKKMVLTLRSLSMDLMAHSVTLSGVALTLTNKEFSLLELLMRNKGRIVTRTQILEKVWDAHHDMETNLLDVYMRRLRLKLDPGEDRHYIKTHRGVGYSLE